MIEAQRVEVYRGGHKDDPGDLFGPLPGMRRGDVLAYEMRAPDRFEPWPGRSRVERIYVLLDLGISLSIPSWRRALLRDGTRIEIPATEEETWYIDLITVDQPEPGTFLLRDLFIDVMVPSDSRHYRMLDLDEFGDAIEAGKISISDAADGLRRWQRFLDRHLHHDRFPQAGWTDFPPAALRPLRELPGLFGPAVTWPD
ncbi:ribonuclease FAU-1 family protein [Microlunatus parietis]|uniref:DUF402 domain-containing protein n=1 Tax=Microlunatus parietis TaxID=682979 RepID=A0A7Y9LDB9_9ACTN|nr:DUF402 domain-containing protein [Microlunatus parietis]NYE72615.1 hypothetical protein [Microlunatus parietis]